MSKKLEDSVMKTDLKKRNAVTEEEARLKLWYAMDAMFNHKKSKKDKKEEKTK